MSIAAGTLYMILKRLKEAGYVETYLQESASGPARKYYHLTEAGTAYQQEKKTGMAGFHPADQPTDFQMKRSDDRKENHDEYNV